MASFALPLPTLPSPVCLRICRILAAAERPAFGSAIIPRRFTLLPHQPPRHRRCRRHFQTQYRTPGQGRSGEIWHHPHPTFPFRPLHSRSFGEREFPTPPSASSPPPTIYPSRRYPRHHAGCLLIFYSRSDVARHFLPPTSSTPSWPFRRHLHRLGHHEGSYQQCSPTPLVCRVPHLSASPRHWTLSLIWGGICRGMYAGSGASPARHRDRSRLSSGVLLMAQGIQGGAFPDRTWELLERAGWRTPTWRTPIL